MHRLSISVPKHKTGIVSDRVVPTGAYFKDKKMEAAGDRDSRCAWCLEALSGTSSEALFKCPCGLAYHISHFNDGGFPVTCPVCAHSPFPGKNKVRGGTSGAFFFKYFE